MIMVFDVVERAETDMVDGCRDEKNAEKTQQETARVILKRSGAFKLSPVLL